MTQRLEKQKKEQHRISRKLTVDALAPYMTIRPVIKKADKEAADTLTEAFKDSTLLYWITGSIKDETKRMDMYRYIFKLVVRAAAHTSRENALQINGCNGVMLWSEGEAEALTLGNIMGKRKLWTFLGGLATFRASIIHHRSFSKAKKRIMGSAPHLVISYLGILPSKQRHQLGTSLLKSLTDKADEAQLPIFAEAWGKASLDWFERHRFVVHEHKDLEDDRALSVYYIVREPLITTAPSPAPALSLEPPREDTLVEQA